MITKWKKFILTRRSYPLVIGAPSVTRKKTMTIKLTENESAYVDETDFSRIRSHVMNEVEEEKEKKYVQLEFEFDEDLVAPI